MDDRNELYYRLFNALQTATLLEIRLAQFVHETKGIKQDDPLMQKIGTITSVVLPESMGRLIGILDIHSSFLSVGRYIRSFADAEFVTIKLQDLIIDQLGKNQLTESRNAINRIESCCSELTEVAAALMATGSLLNN